MTVDIFLSFEPEAGEDNGVLPLRSPPRLLLGLPLPDASSDPLNRLLTEAIEGLGHQPFLAVGLDCGGWLHALLCPTEDEAARLVEELEKRGALSRSTFLAGIASALRQDHDAAVASLSSWLAGRDESLAVAITVPAIAAACPLIRLSEGETDDPIRRARTLRALAAALERAPGNDLMRLAICESVGLALARHASRDSGNEVSAEAVAGGRAFEPTVVAATLEDPAPGAAFSEPPSSKYLTAPSRNQPLVSILCVTYNQENFVRDAVQSILAQTYSPLDIVILDDASPDGTADVVVAELARYSSRENIRFIRNERNLGFLANIRKGVSLARGEFVVVCCGDDVFLPQMVEKMAQVWRQADVSLVTANVRYIDKNGTDLQRFFTDPSGHYDDDFETLARNGTNATCFGAVMGFEPQLIKEFGYPPEYLTTEDIMLPFYAYLAKGARFIPEPLARYRMHDQNTALGLEREYTTGIDRLLVDAEIYFIHLLHSVEMANELDRRFASDPDRFGDTARRIQPLLAEQTREMAKKLVDTRVKLAELGVTRLISPKNFPAPRK